MSEIIDIKEVTVLGGWDQVAIGDAFDEFQQTVRIRFGDCGNTTVDVVVGSWTFQKVKTTATDWTIIVKP